MFLVLIIFFFTFALGNNCIAEVEVELWGNCYNIQTTTQLNVSGAGLSGEIPAQIGSLSNLYLIDLSNNRLSGQIPLEIGNLINLNFFRMYF